MFSFLRHTLLRAGLVCLRVGDLGADGFRDIVPLEKVLCLDDPSLPEGEVRESVAELVAQVSGVR